MKTHFSKFACVLSVAIFAGPALADFDYFADSSAKTEVSFLSFGAETTFSEASFLGDAQEQKDGCKGGCYSACGCVGSIPNMIGDSIGVPLVQSAGAGLLGLARHFTKVAENNNVLPQTRISFSYNMYDNVPKTWSVPGNVTSVSDVSEFKLFAEKKLGCGDWSVNIVLPFYHTVKFNQSTAAVPGVEGGEFGNLAFGFKRVLRRRANYAVSGGLSVEAPTSEDTMGFGGAGRIANDQWFFTPYLAMQYTPNDHWFAQGFASYRMRTGDNLLDGGPTVFIQSDRLMLDAAIGYWLFRDDCSRKFVSGLAPTIELHYMTLTESQSDPLLFTSTYFDRVDTLNLTAGATAELAKGGTLALAAAVPLRTNTFPGGNLPTDRSMDWELVVQYNRPF